MDGKVMQQIREALLERFQRGNRTGNLMDLEANTELNPPSAEIIDIAQTLEQLGRDTSLAEAERRELLAVERALSKMSTGNFGVCEDCGEEIPAKRLMVLPEARLCANCQAYEEKLNSRMRTGATAR